MMYRIEYIRTSFLSLYNDRSGPRSGAPRSLRTGAYRWMLGSSRHTTGGLTSRESYGPRFSIPPWRDLVMSVRSSGTGEGTLRHGCPVRDGQRSAISPHNGLMRRCS